MDSIQWNQPNQSKEERKRDWTMENLHEMGSDFLRLVLVNMGDPLATVRFDHQFFGYSPNYIVIATEDMKAKRAMQEVTDQWENYMVTPTFGIKTLFDGETHEESYPVEILHLSHFSEPFSYEQIRTIYQQLEDEHKHHP